MRREANFHGKFLHFIRAEFADESAVFEVKQTTTNSLPFSAVKPHQVNALLAAQTSALTFKPSDQAQGYKPCDFIHVAGVSAYVAIKYPQKFVLIDIEKWIREIEISKRKSLTFARACEIAEMVRD